MSELLIAMPSLIELVSNGWYSTEGLSLELKTVSVASGWWMIFLMATVST